MEHFRPRAVLVSRNRAVRTKAPTRSELCQELLEIERDNAEIFTRIDAIKTELKLKALADGKCATTAKALTSL
jgi:hypothetical protein